MEKERFLAFTDAIIAIIATIMVLEFKTPDKSGWPALAELTILLLAYALSFFMIMTVGIIIINFIVTLKILLLEYSY
ncbi:TMEM175 family protein [Lactococcus lactis]|uniref:TMEM175 family protein n=1 Tax=Lactococcus lactis TaxID=1358 RepID=UPI0024E2667E|nr:TMEM175 family protein [Lactococcus lactis]